jgi:hypothetical protein
MSDGTRSKWDYLAGWINERATAAVDATARVNELMGRHGSKAKSFQENVANGTGMDVHDADIAAAAQRFLDEHNAQQEDAPTVRQQTRQPLQPATEEDVAKFFGQTPVSPVDTKVVETNDPKVVIAQGIDTIAALLKAILVK